MSKSVADGRHTLHRRRRGNSTPPGMAINANAAASALVTAAPYRGNTGALKFQWEHPEAVAWSSSVVDDAVGVRVLACQKACPARRTEWRRDECVRETRPFAREPVHIRRVDERMPGHSHLIPAHVVDEHHDDVRSARCGRRRGPVRGVAWRRTRGREKRDDDYG